MRYFALNLTLWVSLLLKQVAAQSREGKSGFEAPPLQQANLAFYAFFTIAGLIQIAIAVSYLFRGRSPHLPPGIGCLVAFLFLVLSNGISVASTIARFTYDEDHELALSVQSILSFSQRAQLFNDWADPLLFCAISLILRDRYNTNARRPPSPSRSPLAPPNTGLHFSLLIFAMGLPLFVTPTISTISLGKLYTSLYNLEISQAEFDAKELVADRYRHAFVGVDVITTIILLSFAIVVRGRAKRDRISYFTLYAIMPLICLHTLARIIFEILDDHLPRKRSYTTHTADVLDLSSTVVYHTLFFAVSCFVSYFFLHPRLWNRPSRARQYPSRFSSDHSPTHRSSRPSSQMTDERGSLPRQESTSESPLPGDPDRSRVSHSPRVITIPMEQMPTGVRKTSDDFLPFDLNRVHL